MSIQRYCPPAEIAAGDYGAEAVLFKALADPHRLRMLATLAAAQDEVCVCDFTDALPLNQPTVSHHLRILREAQLVTCERRGTWVYYRLASGARARIDGALSSRLHTESHGMKTHLNLATTDLEKSVALTDAGLAQSVEREDVCCYANQPTDERDNAETLCCR